MNEGNQPWRHGKANRVGMRRVVSVVTSSKSPSARPGSAERAPCRGGPVWRPLGMLSSGGGRGSRSRKLAAEAAVLAALTRARQLRGLEDGGRGRGHGRWGRRRRQGPRERGAPPPPPLIRWGQSPGLRPGRRPRRLSSESREPGDALRRELGRAEPAPSRRHGPPPRATEGTSRRNPRASSRPSLSDPRVLRRPLPPPYFLPCSRCCCRFSSPLWQRSRHPLSGLRRPAPQKCGPHRRARPPARAPRSRRAAGSASSTAACPSRIRWPGTCTGRTKWVSGGGAELAAPLPPYASPGPAEVAWGPLAGPDAPPGVYAAPPVSSAFPQSLATRAAGARKVVQFLGCGASGGQQEVAGRGVSGLRREGGY